MRGHVEHLQVGKRLETLDEEEVQHVGTYYALEEPSPGETPGPGEVPLPGDPPPEAPAEEPPPADPPAEAPTTRRR